jgi:hypothetical protein
MPTSTADLNPHPERCDAYHEAGHAVVGVVRGLQLTSVTGQDAGHTPPHCAWDHGWVNGLLDTADQPGVPEQINAFTEFHAEMCLASRYAEALVCNVKSDEQQEALHYDYVDAERVRYQCGLGYFGWSRIQQLKQSAEALVNGHAKAIKMVADKLLAGQTLTKEQVAAIIEESKAVAE